MCHNVLNWKYKMACNKSKKGKFNFNFIKLRMQLLLLSIFLLFLYEKCLVGQIRAIFEIINIKGVEQIFVELFMPLRLLFNASKIFTIAYLIIELVIVIAITKCIIFIIKRLLAKIDYKKTNKINTYQIINSCRLEDAYFLQHRFLC